MYSYIVACAPFTACTNTHICVPRYVADTQMVHNTIHDSRYSGICAGWYIRNPAVDSLSDPSC